MSASPHQRAAPAFPYHTCARAATHAAAHLLLHAPRTQPQTRVCVVATTRAAQNAAGVTVFNGRPGLPYLRSSLPARGRTPRVRHACGRQARCHFFTGLFHWYTRHLRPTPLRARTTFTPCPHPPAHYPTHTPPVPRHPASHHAPPACGLSLPTPIQNTLFFVVPTHTPSPPTLFATGARARTCHNILLPTCLHSPAVGR